MIEAGVFTPEGLIPEPELQTGSGNEKIVYPVRYGGELCAAKVFREISTGGVPIDRGQRSTDEFNATRIAFNSEIGLYVPEPITTLASRQGERVGLLVAWRDGENLRTDVKIPRDYFEKLRLSLLKLPPECQLTHDSITQSNVCWGGDNLWLAEVMLERYIKPGEWSHIVNYEIDSMVEEFAEG